MQALLLERHRLEETEGQVHSSLEDTPVTLQEEAGEDKIQGKEENPPRV